MRSEAHLQLSAVDKWWLQARSVFFGVNAVWFSRLLQCPKLYF
jgi:hypothetical protein